MSQSFLFKRDPNTGCVKTVPLRTSDGIQWTLNEERARSDIRITLSRANDVHKNKLYFVQLKELCSKTITSNHRAYSNQLRNSDNVEKSYSMFETEEDIEFSITSDYKMHSGYADYLQITLIPVTKLKKSEPEEVEIEKSLQNEKVTNFDKLSASMGNILRNEILADVVLKTDTCAINAHKLILAAQSSVFQKMFSVDMKEALNNVVKISDIKDGVLKAMLSYMYTNEITFTDMETTRALYVAADKYFVKDLKDICSSWLNCMTVDSAVDTLVLADDHSDEILKLAALEFIAAHYASIKQSSKWQSLLKERLALAIEFLSYKVDLMER